MINFVTFLCVLKFAACADIGNSTMLINDQVIDVEYSKSPPHYTGKYTYNDGELAKFTCIRDASMFAIHTIIYNDEGNQYNVIAVDETSSSLYIKLKKDSSPKFIECNMSKLFSNISNVIRIQLTLKSNKGAPKLKVNNLPLSPLISSTKFILKYIYEYDTGEKLNVSIDNLRKLICNSSEKAVKMLVKDLQKYNKITLNTDVFEYIQVKLTCLGIYYDGNNYKIDLKFAQNQDLKTYPQITGLSSSSVIAKFTNTTEQHVKIIYPYYNNETLVLNCSMRGAVAWTFNDSEVATKPLIYSTPSGYEATKPFVVTQSFALKENVNSTVLNCSHYGPGSNKDSQLVLVRTVRNTPDSEKSSRDGVIHPSDRNNLTISINSSLEDTNSDNPNYNGQAVLTNKLYGNNEMTRTTDDGSVSDPTNFYIIIGVVVGIIIIAIILITIILVSKMKRKITKSESDINYRNLPEHNGGPMPIPSQWNANRAYSTECLYSNVKSEPTYAKAIPKSQRNKLKETYSVPHTSNDPSYEYATPYNGSNQGSSEYAEVIPKSQRNKEAGNTNTKINTQKAKYAQPIPKSLRNNVKLNKVQPSSDGYAEIEDIRNRAESDKNKYANVFDRERYMNAKPSDYIEPAYASIGQNI